MANTTPARIAVIGAAGEVAKVVIETLLRHTDHRLVLADVNHQALARCAVGLPAERVTFGRVDLFEPERLRDTIRGAALVVNGAGPFARTAQPVIAACAAEKIDYLDYDDDPASTLDAIEAEDRLAESGVRCLKNCGHSPGITNVLAVAVTAELDEVESLDVCWALGDEGAHVYGRAVVEHWLEVIRGRVPAWVGRRATTVEAFRATEVYPLAGDLGYFRLYEVGHPEPISLPRRYPAANRIRCMGGLHPQPVNGLSRGIAEAIEHGAITVDEAIDWVQQVFNDKSGSLRIWRYAVAGIWHQYRRGEITTAELLTFLQAAIRKKHWPWQGAAAAKATGTRDGERVTVLLRTPPPGPESSLWTSLARCTGVACAAFVKLALSTDTPRCGLLFPEDWVQPADFYRALTEVGVRKEDIVDPLIRLPTDP